MPHICSNFGQPCKMCAQKATANCVKYAKRAKCAKMCPILAEAPTVDTTALEEAFEFKAREEWGGRIKCQLVERHYHWYSGTDIGTVDQSGEGGDIGRKTCELSTSQKSPRPQHCLFTELHLHSFYLDNTKTHIDKSPQSLIRRLKEPKTLKDISVVNTTHLIITVLQFSS